MSPTDTQRLVAVIFSILRILAAVYIGLCIVLYFIQKKIVYMPSTDMWITPSEIGLVYEDVFLPAGEVTIHGWYMPYESARGTVIICHGNAGNICGRLDPAKLYHEAGMNVLLFDYRGYGRSTGSPHEEGLYQDAQAAWDFVVHTKGESPNRVVVVGRSLGGGPATWLAAKQQPAGLVLESTFSSAVDVAKGIYPYLPVGLIQTERFNNSSRINDVVAPILFVHGKEDEVIHYTHGMRLYEARTGDKSLIEIEGGHNDVREYQPSYRKAVFAYLESVLTSDKPEL